MVNKYSKISHKQKNAANVMDTGKLKICEK